MVPFFPRIAIIIGILLIPSHAALALVIPLIAGIPLLNLFGLLFLFLFVPLALIGFILRLFGFKKNKSGKGWRFNLRDAFLRLLGYLLYHSSLFGIWFVIYYALTGNSYAVGRYSYLTIDEAPFLLYIYLALFALVWPYCIYLGLRLIGRKKIRPSITSHIVLFIWNFIIFYIVERMLWILV
jgi:hypothetical protein